MFEISAVCNHRPPARRRRRDAESEERERRFCHDCAGHTERRSDHHRGDDVWQDVLSHDSQVTRAERPDSLDVLELPHHQNLPADDTRHSGPADDSDRREHDRF